MSEQETREKVIKWLEICINGCDDSCPYKNECESKGGFIAPMTDALALLKAQEPIKPHYTRLEYMVNGMPVVVNHPECPKCVENGLVLWDAEIEKGTAYCKRCGQAVKWK